MPLAELHCEFEAPRRFFAAYRGYIALRHSSLPERRAGLEAVVIVLGVVLLIIGFLTGMGIVWTLGIILCVIGLILAVMGGMGRELGGRRYWY